MANITAKTFPGVYTQVTDQSFITPPSSRFKPGLIGVASRGAFDTPTTVRSLRDFVTVFGSPIATTYQATNEVSGIAGDSAEPVGNGAFLADTVSLIGDMTDSITVVRVGNQYKDLPDGGAAVAAISGAMQVKVSTSDAAYIQSLITAQQAANNEVGVYIAVSETDVASSVNLEVASISAGTNVNLVDPLISNYTSPTVQYAEGANAAWSAEGFLSGYTWTSVTVSGATAVNFSADKNAFIYDAGTGSSFSTLAVGDLMKITASTGTTTAETHEVRVSAIAGSKILFDRTNNTKIGYQAVPLQASYTYGSVSLYKASGTTTALLVTAATPGDWANGATSKQGLYVAVRPGSSAGSKKLEVYHNSSLVETFDNLSYKTKLSDGTTDNPNFYETRINGISSYITVQMLTPDVTHPANTVAPWSSAFYNAVATTGMVAGAVNAGDLSVPNSTSKLYTGGQFKNGYNGENPSTADFIGTYDEVSGEATGLKCFEDRESVDINILAAPMDDIDIGVMEEMRRVCRKINAYAIADVPAGIPYKDAIDWHNSAGAYLTRGMIDDAYIGVFWNWFGITSAFDGELKLVPPTLGVLRAMGETFNKEQPWRAVAGETRGVIPEAKYVQFTRVSDDVKQAAYGNGNSVNPILKMRGRFVIYGERTMQRAESKLTAQHSVILTNYIVNGLAEIGRRFVFEPNDAELLDNIRLAFTEFLDKVKNDRGLEAYELIVDSSNNNATNRNNREVIVDLTIIPTDVAERIYLNAVVRESGAELVNVS